MDLRTKPRTALRLPSLVATGALLLSGTAAEAQDREWFAEPDEHGWPVLAEWGWTKGRVDGRAPFGVGLDDGVGVGDLRLAYRYAATEFDGLRDGTGNLSSQDAFDAGFNAAPTGLRAATHHFSLRYGLTEGYTLAASLPFHDRSMDAVTSAGEEFSLDSSGIGDLRFGTLYLIDTWGREKAFFTLFGSWPIGPFDQRGSIPGQGSGRVLPYSLQLGSGTVDVTPGLLLLGQADSFSWGFGVDNTFRLTENDQDYRLGGRSQATGWIAWKLGSLAPSARLSFVRQGNAHGADTRQDTSFAGVDDNALGYRRLDLSAGLTFARGGTGARLGLEFGLPVYQSVKGPQLAADYFVTFGLQFGF